MTSFNTQSGLNFIGRYDLNRDGLSKQELQMGQMNSFLGAMTSMMSGNQAGFSSAMQDLQFASVAGQNFDILSQASQTTPFGDNNSQTINPLDLMKTASNDGNINSFTPQDVQSQNRQNNQAQNPMMQMMQMFMMFMQMMLQMMGMGNQQNDNGFNLNNNNSPFGNNGAFGNNGSFAAAGAGNNGSFATAGTGNNFGTGTSNSLTNAQPTNATRNPGAGTFGGKKLSQEQVNNARIIAEEGAKMGASKRDISIAIATAMQESQLKNINYGDRDSVGLFQQRPSCGWGSVAQCTDPRYASQQFYKHLLKDGNRNNKSLTHAAQDVQRSAYPNAYAKWENMAVSLTNSIC